MFSLIDIETLVLYLAIETEGSSDSEMDQDIDFVPDNLLLARSS